MKGFHFFCQWPAVIWIKHWFYPKFSRCVRDGSLPPRETTCTSHRRGTLKEKRMKGWRWETAERIRTGEETILKRNEGDGRDAGRGGEHRGVRRKNRGFGKQQLREEKRRGGNTQWWMSRDSHRIERGTFFFWSAVFNSLFTFTHCPTPATAHLC